MKVLAVLVLASLTTILQAQVPVLHEDELQLDAVATLSDSGERYYRDVVLRREASGKFTVVAAQLRPLVAIHTVEVQLSAAAGMQASVAITGLTSVACVGLEEPAVSRVGSVFHVVLAETLMAPGSVCESLLPNRPFAITLPLVLAALPSGSYSVAVNGVTANFVYESP